MTEQDFKTKLSQFNLNKEGKVSAKSSSNIALIKYWGKTEPQIPTNPSISYTLSKSFTESKLIFSPKKGKVSNIKVFLDNVEKDSFIPKIKKFFERIEEYAPYINAFDFTLYTQNSFPHSSGIASSASGMSALSKSLIQMEDELGFQHQVNPDIRASFLSRLGSGSACRSIFNGLVNWGENKAVKGSSNLYATPLDIEIHPVFKDFYDTILLIHEGSKTVSSSVGHSLMNNHPYAERRFEEAKENIHTLIEILENGDLEAFGKLVEHEALTLHALMMMSDPAFILMKPNTVSAINKVWGFRKETKQPLFFTLDAGANVHLLYPKIASDAIDKFIKNELLPLCQNNKAIHDIVKFD